MSADEQHSDFWDQPYYKTTKTLSCLIGQWPYQTTTELIVYRGIFIILISMQLIPQCLAVRRYYDDFDMIMESSGPFLIDVLGTLNVTTCIMNLSKMRHLLDEVRENWQIVTEKYGRHLFHEYAESTKSVVLLYAAINYSASIVFTSDPLQVELMNLVFRVNSNVPMFFMEMDYPGIDVIKYRYLLIFLSIIAVFIIVSAVISIDLLFFLYAQHLCGLFAALGYAIENLPVPAIDGEHHRFDEAYEHMKYCVQLHNRAIRFSRQLEEIFMWNFLILLGLNMILMCFAAFEIAVTLDELAKLFKNSVLVGAEIAYIYILCYMSQKIMDHSLRIQTHVENSNWFCCSVKTQKLMRFMMMRSQIPCQLTAGKVIVMSLETFTVQAKTSASYFTVLLAMR